MNAEQLISMAAARGVDLCAAAKQSADTKGKPQTRSHVHAGMRFIELLEQPERRAYGKSTRTMVQPEWTGEDAALALAGLGRTQTLAALYAWAGARENYWSLVTELRMAAERIRRRHSWPDLTVSHDGQPRPYIERMCEMVLFDDQHPGVLDYAPPATIGGDDHGGILRAVACEVTLPVWRAQLAPRYAHVWGVWVGWLDEAARRVQAKLHDDED